VIKIESYCAREMDSSMEGKRQTRNDAGTHENVLSYLRRMSASAASLSQSNASNGDEDSPMDIDDPKESTATYYLDRIARDLLAACRPRVLATGIGNLPQKEEQENDVLVLDTDEEDDEMPVRQLKRTDYLRQFLRVLAPISMDVAAHVCSIALSSTATTKTMSEASFLLMSHWLPVAPHLTPMVSDLFNAFDCPWNSSQMITLETEFLIAEASHSLCAFYLKRGEIAGARQFWNWTYLFIMLESKDVQMEDPATEDDKKESFSAAAIRWHAARALGCLMDWKASAVFSFLQRLRLDDEQVSWVVHPWALDEEEATTQHLQLCGLARLWNSEDFPLPSSEQVRTVLTLHSWLAQTGMGIIFYKHRALIGSIHDSGPVESTQQQQAHPQQHLITTATTCRNLSLLGSALCQQPYPPPILVCGPHGSGKSSLVRELVRLCCPNDTLLEIHVDEETDSKTLIGSYTITDIPGEFAWRPGALTCATREGQWVLLEDVDSVPPEIQASLVKLLEDRLVPLGNGKYERCHPNFRLFGTCTTASSTQQQRESLRIGGHRSGGKRILHPSLWRKVHVKPLPFSELKEIVMALHPDIPELICESALALLQALDRSGRAQSTHKQEEAIYSDAKMEEDAPQESQVVGAWTIGRQPSVRDFFKLLSRISNGICFERNVTYATEAQRTLCLAESFDIFAASCADREVREHFVGRIAAPIWGITRDLALRYVETRRPTTLIGADFTEVGRAKIEVVSQSEFSRVPSETFAQTNHALRLMESIGVCIRENEPVLLVGETGCGKTTLVQQLAAYCERELIVQNLSLQTDSTDLLGGYRPLELQHVARQVYREFVDIFVATFSRKQNAQFLEYAYSMREKCHWKKLSQCFDRAAKLGLSQVNERNKKSQSSDARKGKTSIKSWIEFQRTAERFERQRLACDSGLAFTFSEGALVDAIRTGKWYVISRR
jgi:MoxR-like ATPase